MSINKGLKSLVESSPNFSNQGLENAINDIKTKVNSDWVTKTFTLDTAIRDNTVLTTTQKNDLLETVSFPATEYLNIGRYLNDVIRHTSTILDGTIIPGDPDIETEDDGRGSFLEILQTVQSIQTLIPQLYGVPASEKNRDVNDHLGLLNNKFLETEDSSKPVFELITENLQQMMRLTSHSSAFGAVADGGTHEVAIDNLLAFLDSIVADSTDFQQTLDMYALLVKNSFIGMHQYLTNLGIYGNHTDIQAIQAQAFANYNTVQNQRLLEISNVSGIRTYVETLSNNVGYASLAEDTELRKLMSRVSQNADWQTYFNDYETNLANLDPMYDDIATDSDKEGIIDQVLKDRGLPDVLDYVDLEAVANKAKKDSRIDTAGFDLKTVEQIITDACKQLGITTSDRTIYSQSQVLLNSMNDRDRQQIADALDLNESSNTIS